MILLIKFCVKYATSPTRAIFSTEIFASNVAEAKNIFTAKYPKSKIKEISVTETVRCY